MSELPIEPNLIYQSDQANPDQILANASVSEITQGIVDEYYLGVVCSQRQDFLRSILPRLRNDSKYQQILNSAKSSSPDPLLQEVFQGQPALNNLRRQIVHDPANSDDQLLELLYKHLSYKPAVNQQRESIKKDGLSFQGTSEDPDFDDVPRLLFRVFGVETLARALVSGVRYYPDAVIIPTDGGNEKQFSRAEFRKILDSLPVEAAIQLVNRKVRALTSTVFNEDTTSFLPFPVILFAFTDSDIQNIPYLSKVDTRKRMRIMKIGTVCHEIGHGLYSLSLSSKTLKEWEDISASEDRPVTEYVKRYCDNPDLRQEEGFAESVRLRVTAPDYLEDNFPRVANYFTRNFPDIQPLQK
ncbi:hypothetical protein KGQ71_03100 [Patescibacteria group bacterium]|nr:hypothetical protein [Patescibacteria group bacterium]